MITGVIIEKTFDIRCKGRYFSYGMGEKSMLALAQALKGGREWRNIRGLSYIAKEKKTAIWSCRFLRSV